MTDKDIKIIELAKVLKGRSTIAKAEWDNFRKQLDDCIEKEYGYEACSVLIGELREARLQAIIYGEISDKLMGIAMSDTKK